MGRELARQLSSDGCHVAICDVIAQNMDETKRLCEEAAPPKTRVTTHECDVSDETQVIAFRDAVSDRHDTEHINLLFNNAGIGHVTSFVTGPGIRSSLSTGSASTTTPEPLCRCCSKAPKDVSSIPQA